MTYYNDFDAQTHHYYQNLYEKQYDQKLKENYEKIREKTREEDKNEIYTALIKEGVPEELVKKVFSNLSSSKKN